MNKAALILKNIKKSKSSIFDTKIFENTQLLLAKCTSNQLVFGFNVQKEFCNLHGTMHGGAISTLIDCATTIHAFSADPSERVSLSTDLSTSFFTAVAPNQYIEIITSLVGLKESLAYTTALLTVEDKIVARGTQTLYFLNIQNELLKS